MIIIIILYAILGFTFICAKQTLLYAQPFFLVAFRMIIAGSILLCYQYCHKEEKRRHLSWNDAGLFLQAAFFNIYLSFLLEFWALQYLSGLKAAIFYAPTPFITALFSYFLYNEQLSSLKILGMLIGLVGVMVVIITRTTDSVVHMINWFNFSLSEIILAGAVIIGAYSWFTVKKLLLRGYRISTINGISMLIGGILSGLTSFIVEGGVMVNDWFMFFCWVGLLIVASNFLFYTMYGYLIKHYSLTLISCAGFLSPIFTALYEKILFGTVITWHYYIGIFCVALGLYIFYRDDLRLLSEPQE